MRIFLTLTIIFVGLQSALAQTDQGLDYSKLKPEHFERLTNKQTFTDSKSKETYEVYKTDEKRGLKIQVTINGKMRFVRHGKFFCFYKGKKTRLITYEYGEKDGLSEAYRKDGKIKSRVTYQDGQKHGLSELFNSKNQLAIESQYSDGLKNGVSKTYYNGRLNFKTSWVDGKRHGEKIQYNTSNGNVVSIRVYSKNKLVSKSN